MWRRDPLTRENQSQEIPTGQQQPTAAHSVNLHPAVLESLLCSAPPALDALQECATVQEN